MGIKAVFFDVGSTLLYPSPSVAQAFTTVATRRGHVVSLDEVERHMPAVDAYYEQEYARDGDFWCSHDRAMQIWLDMYVLLAHLTGLQHDARGLSEDVHACFRSADYWATYDDVERCLRELRHAGFHLGLISNWDAGLEGLFRDLGLLPYFDVVVASAAVGYRKPDPAIFEIALERMGVRACEAVHVGDLPEADGAAASVGIRPVIIDRHGFHGACGYDRVGSLLELPALIEGVSAGHLAGLGNVS